MTLKLRRFRNYACRVLVIITPLLSSGDIALSADELAPEPCTEDAMIVFDASGSMAGYVDQGIATAKPRIDEVRSALANVLKSATRFRRVGLISFGPGRYNQCNVHLDLRPVPDAAERIMRTVNGLIPAGKTPLTSAVEQAANVLDYRDRPGTVVVITDGEETCGRSPCELSKQLRSAAAGLTIHVISYRLQGFSWTGEQSITATKCLAELSGGLYVTATTQQELITALERTLSCPMISKSTLR